MVEVIILLALKMLEYITIFYGNRVFALFFCARN